MDLYAINSKKLNYNKIYSKGTDFLACPYKRTTYVILFIKPLFVSVYNGAT